MKFSAVCFVILLVFKTSKSSFNYDGYKVYQVTPETREEANILKEFEYDNEFDFWSDIRLLNAPVDIMVSPVAQEKFEAVLNTQNIEYTTLIDNVEDPDFHFRKIQQQSIKQSRATRVDAGSVTFTEFMRHDEILAYIEQVAANYPGIAQTEIIGKSFEGRDLTVLKISSGGANKPIIFAEAAIHAREWIAPPVALYMINQLVENPDNADMYQDVDWVIFPVVNPDGYEFSHVGTRLWRKTRTPGTICDGADGNRNFDYQWMVTGASSWQCSETYAGHAPFSEVETRAVRNYLLANSNIKLFLDIHSYGQWILYPWGFTSEYPENVDELHSLGDRVNAAIYAVRGTNYTVGSSNEILYASSGGSRDYAKGVAGIELGYTIELPGGGSAGFNIDASEITPVVTETWEGIKVFHAHIQEKFGS